MIYDTVIVGGGMAGLAAAIYLRRANKTVLVLESVAYGGQILMTDKVENYPGFEAISGPDLMKNVHKQAENLGVEFKCAEVLGLVDGEVKKVQTDEGEVLARTVVLAVGSAVRKLGVTGESKYDGKGLSYCATCDGAFYKDKNVAVVGGGNTALYEALYLSGMAQRVYLINRGMEFKGEAVLLEKLEKKKNVEILLDSPVTEIWGDEKVEGIEVGEQKLAVSGVFVAVGRRPDTERFTKLVQIDKNGYIVAGEDCKTSVKGIFAIGDCRTKTVRQLVTATGDAAVAASGVVEFLKV